MDKKAIKTFAIGSRVKLREGVMNKLAKLGITSKGIEKVILIGNDTIEIPSNGERFTEKSVSSRAKLVDELNKRENQTENYDIAYDTLVEEVAYTWFNRLIAIRFMEVNDYLPERQRILSSEIDGKREPDIITNIFETGLYSELDRVTKDKVTKLLSDGSASAVDELYQLIFIKQCNSLNQQLPDLFEKIDDFTELLFTISYIDENGVIADILTIEEDDFNVDKGGQVEIIGWMYQYYNTEPKDKVFARGNRKIRADEIPAATQLFTPDWIVRYMVENSLGRYYIDQKMANSTETRTEKEIADEFGWKYYLPTAEQPEEIQIQIASERKKKNVFALQELKFLDNAMGSGHILVYAFDVFMKLYKSEGFRERDAVELIMSNNLFGLEIDKRAYQLAYFAIMMKGREYSRRILAKNMRLNLHQFINSDDIPNELFERIEELSPLPRTEYEKKLKLLKSILTQFINATEIGSVLNFSDIKQTEINELREFIDIFSEFSDMDILYQLPESLDKVRNIFNIIEVITAKYEAIATNPPYLNKMSPLLDRYVKSNYIDVKTDLFSIFIKVNSTMLTRGGYAGFMTPFVWMFIKSYEELRTFLITNKSISSLIQMEYSAFEEATVPVCCFTIKDGKTELVGNYFKLSDFRGGMEVQHNKVIEAIDNPSVSYFYQTNQQNFTQIPGNPISFWVSENLIHNFIVGKQMKEYGIIKSGIMVNSRFILDWSEVKVENINFHSKSASDMFKYKWFPLNSGGGKRKWFGNNIPIINLENFGEEIKNSGTNYRLRNSEYYFKQGITWGRITSGDISFRKSPLGNLFGDAGPMMFIDTHLNQLLALSNSKVMLYFADIFNPTLNFQVDDMKNIPVILENETEINQLVDKLINIARSDWNTNETSWDFMKSPLI